MAICPIVLAIILQNIFLNKSHFLDYAPNTFTGDLFETGSKQDPRVAFSLYESFNSEQCYPICFLSIEC